MTRYQVTIKDVAQRAGCGVATVSRVLNGSGSASPAMRERVERAARELNFTFSALGRALQSRTSGLIGCLAPSLANPVFAEAVQGAQEELSAAGYQVLLMSSNYDIDEDERAIRALLASDVEGLILTVADPHRVKALQQVRDRRLPCVLQFHTESAGFASAHTDHAAAGKCVAREFARRGHRHSGFLALRFRRSDRSRERYAAFHDEAQRMGLPAPALLEVDERESALPEHLRSLLEANPELTAIFASNDYLALALVRAARSIGRRVPDDLSVVGYDGIELGRLMEPPLATIATDPDAIGREAARALLEAIAGTPAPALAPLPFTFRSGGTLGVIGGAENHDGKHQG